MSNILQKLSFISIFFLIFSNILRSQTNELNPDKSIVLVYEYNQERIFYVLTGRSSNNDFYYYESNNIKRQKIIVIEPKNDWTLCRLNQPVMTMLLRADGLKKIERTNVTHLHIPVKIARLNENKTIDNFNLISEDGETDLGLIPFPEDEGVSSSHSVKSKLPTFYLTYFFQDKKENKYLYLEMRPNQNIYYYESKSIKKQIVKIIKEDMEGIQLEIENKIWIFQKDKILNTKFGWQYPEYLIHKISKKKKEVFILKNN